MKHWPRLPRETVDVPSLETFQIRFDVGLSNLIWLKVSLLTAAHCRALALDEHQRSLSNQTIL